ncbi:MAG: TadE/TadG family type IV pilus assembly protein [Thermomicrobiales bacterium]
MFRRLRRQAPRPGQSVVEFSIVSLVLMVLLVGVLDLGRGVLYRSMLTNAVREGARYGLVVNRRTIADDTTFTSNIATAAANRSPSLNLTAANFTSGGGMVQCSAWVSDPPGNPPPLRTCSSTDTNVTIAYSTEKLTVCASYQFQLIAPRLIGLTTIPMLECSVVPLQ